MALTASFGVAAPAHAQSAAAQPVRPAGDTIRLSDQEREAVLDGNTVESAAAARGEATGADRAALDIHGEVGAMVGSHGSRGIYGTAAIPLGDHAGAVVSFESDRIGTRR